MTETERYTVGIDEYSEECVELWEQVVKLKEENDRIKTKGLELLDFYERQLFDAYGTECYQPVNDAVSLVRFVLCEMGVINNE